PVQFRPWPPPSLRQAGIARRPAPMPANACLLAVIAAESRALHTLRGLSVMTDFAALRRTMVDGQVRTADVTDQRLLAAMLEVPRERFMPDDKAPFAYLDQDIAVTDGGPAARRLLKPMVLAKLLEAAAIEATDRVLDIGCATGYSTAVLA